MAKAKNSNKKISDIDPVASTIEILANDIAEEQISEGNQNNDTLLDEMIEKITDSVDSVADETNNMDEILDIKNISKSIDSNEEFYCKSITYGGFNWVCPKTGSRYRWAKLGAVEPLTYSAIQIIKQHKPEILEKPYIIILDSRPVKALNLQRRYEKVAKIHEAEKVLNGKNADKIIEFCEMAVSVNMKDVLVSKVRQLRKDRVLSDVDVIKLLEKQLNIELMDDGNNLLMNK